MNDLDVIGNYGIVKVIKGKYKGSFVYYDDDDSELIEEGIDEFNDFDDDEDLDMEYEDRAVVYFGSLLYNSKVEYLPYEYLSCDFTFEDLKNRSAEISTLLWKKISDKKRVSLVEEKNMIDMEIVSRLENYIDTNLEKENRIFLSHSSLDKSIVISVAMDLKEKGLNPWLDSFDILPGESITRKIEQGLENTEFMLLFLSKNSVNSKWVLKEWETMLWDEVNNDKIKIIPIKLEDCKIPKILQTKKYIDFSGSYSIGIHELINTIKRYRENSKVI